MVRGHFCVPCVERGMYCEIVSVFRIRCVTHTHAVTLIFYHTHNSIRRSVTCRTPIVHQLTGFSRVNWHASNDILFYFTMPLSMYVVSNEETSFTGISDIISVQLENSRDKRIRSSVKSIRQSYLRHFQDFQSAVLWCAFHRRKKTSDEPKCIKFLRVMQIGDEINEHNALCISMYCLCFSLCKHSHSSTQLERRCYYFFKQTSCCDNY